MANMVKCKTCGNAVADKAKVCPHCGVKLKKPLYQRAWFIVLIIVAVLIVASAANRILAGYNEAKQRAESTSGMVSESTESAEAPTVLQTEQQSATQTNESEPLARVEKIVSYDISDVVFDHYVSSFGSTMYYGIVEVTNTGNVNLYLRDCVFDLEDDNGHLLQTEDFISSCPDIIAPGEKGYFYRSVSSIDDEVLLDNGLNLNPVVKIEESRGEIVEYEVSDVSLRNGSFGPTVTGRVKNTTEKDDPLFYIEVIYYDQNGRVLAISGTNLTDFTAGSQTSFEISGIGLPNSVTMDNISDYVIVARPLYMQF